MTTPCPNCADHEYGICRDHNPRPTPAETVIEAEPSQLPPLIPSFHTVPPLRALEQRLAECEARVEQLHRARAADRAEFMHLVGRLEGTSEGLAHNVATLQSLFTELVKSVQAKKRARPTHCPEPHCERQDGHEGAHLQTLSDGCLEWGDKR